MFLVHSKMTGKMIQSRLISSRRDAEKRFPFNCSNNVITIGINIIVTCFMLKCETRGYMSFELTRFFPLSFFYSRNVCFI